MPAGVAVAFEGLNQLRRDLLRMDPRWAKELAKVHYQAASLVRAEAIQRAPRGVHEGGGTVAPISSTIVARRERTAAVVVIGGARSPHAVVTEFGGHIPRRTASTFAAERARRQHRSYQQSGIYRRNLTAVRAQPYLYPAVEAKTEAVLELYEFGLDKIMGEAFR